MKITRVSKDMVYNNTYYFYGNSNQLFSPTYFLRWDLVDGVMNAI